MLMSFKYLKEKYGINPKGVIHIGGHFGEELDDYYNNGVERSLWFEADEDSCKILENKLKNYPKASYLNVCLSDKYEELTFNVANNGQSSSILELDYHKIAHPEVHYVSNKKVFTNRLDTYFNTPQVYRANMEPISNPLKIEDYDFLNIDVQGAELKVLQGIGDLLGKIKYAYLEVNKLHLYKDCPLVGEIEEYVGKFGFVTKEIVWSGDHGWGDLFAINENIN